MKNATTFRNLFFASVLLTFTLTSCKDTNASMETETSESYSSDATTDTMPAVPNSEMENSMDTTSTSSSSSSTTGSSMGTGSSSGPGTSGTATGAGTGGSNSGR